MQVNQFTKNYDFKLIPIDFLVIVILMDLGVRVTIQEMMRFEVTEVM